MKITYCVRSTGHFVTIKTDIKEMTLNTVKGEVCELVEHAADLRRKAERLIADANFIDKAVRQLWEE